MSDTDTLQALKKQVETLSRQVGLLEDVNAVRHLHYKYGYYIDKCLYDEAVDLFSESGELRFLNGVYKGKAGARRLYCDWFRNFFTKGHNGPIYGFLLDHQLSQDIIDVAPDGKSAKGRFRCVMQGGMHKSKKDRIAGLPEAFWEGGIYENLYVKEGGVWKINLLNYNMLWQADYDKGWAQSESHMAPLTKLFPEDPNGPDALMEMPKVWPDTRLVPFHYPHPVTGKPVTG